MGGTTDKDTLPRRRTSAEGLRTTAASSVYWPKTSRRLRSLISLVHRRPSGIKTLPGFGWFAAKPEDVEGLKVMRRAGWAERRPSWVRGRPSRAGRRPNRAGNVAGWVMNRALSSVKPDVRVGGPSSKTRKRDGIAKIVALSEVTAPFSADPFDRGPGNGAGTTCSDALPTRNVPFLSRNARLVVVRARFRGILCAPTSRIVRFTTFMSSPPAIPARFTSLTAAFPRPTAGPTPFRCRRMGGERVHLWGKRVLPASGSTGRTGCSICTAEGSTCGVTHRGCAAAARSLTASRMLGPSPPPPSSSHTDGC
jgi:hypothetical protein